ncbi:hypothetical protein FQN60_016181 [Etheostoma spectabile]|uniref:Uncharacterized protein n=1 Tax=Etheostoma spectabile TaxID=54343 RepID=A0A5J5D1G2_9PERO|nr:hypothetical protein FQN60_016181 [Etheostoma spectabile]
MVSDTGHNWKQYRQEDSIGGSINIMVFSRETHEVMECRAVLRGSIYPVETDGVIMSGTVMQTAWFSTNCSSRRSLASSASFLWSGTPAGGSDSGWRPTDVLIPLTLWVWTAAAAVCCTG